MKIFVTGCAGLLGSNYSRHLIGNGNEQIGIDNLYRIEIFYYIRAE